MPRIAVVGVGRWGESHARALSDLDALCAVCDIDAERAKTVGGKYDVHSYTSIEEMLKNEKLDGAVINTPTSTHLTIAKELMEHRIHVLVEAPMAVSSTECEQMRTLARRNNVIISAGYIERFNPAVSAVKNFISQRKYGDIFMLEFHNEKKMSNMHDIGIIYDYSMSDIDTALYLLDDKPNVVFARAGSVHGAQEDFTTIVLGFKNKMASIASNWLTPKEKHQFIARCTGAIITADFVTQELRIDTGGDTFMLSKEFEEPLALELKNFIGAINRSAKPLVSVDDAINTTVVSEAATLSSRSGSPIFIDLK